MKKFKSFVLVLMLLLSVVTSVFSPVWCFESNGQVSLEWSANCVPDKDCSDCFDLQASALENAVVQTIFLAVAPISPIQKLGVVYLQPLDNSTKSSESDHLLHTQFLGKDSVVLLI